LLRLANLKTHPTINKDNRRFQDSSDVAWTQNGGVLYLATPKTRISIAAVTMDKRFLINTLLGVALLFSQGGNFLVGALCPHLRSAAASCDMQVSETEMSHEGMGHAGMGSMSSEPAAQPNDEADALGQPTKPCSHCAVHSRSSSNAISLREADGPRRSADLTIPLTVSTIVPVASSTAPALTSRAHGPPGQSTARHILLNVFRI